MIFLFCRDIPNLDERENAATPSIEGSLILNESVLSGYYGDREDEDESFYEFDGKFMEIQQSPKILLSCQLEKDG